MSQRLKIFKAINPDLKRFEKHFDNYLTNLEFSPYLKESKGKMLRPALTILGAHIGGEVKESTLWAALAVEMMHNATLVHDDVVDDADQRRNKSTFRAENGDKRAVLYGDYLFAKSLECVVKTGDLRIVNAIAATTGDMSIGEIQQLDASGALSTAEQTYYDIIFKKTATLFICSLLVGYYSANEAAGLETLLRQIGLKLGLAFQIKDDIFDYERDGTSGKAYGNDVREQKMTLPLIYALEQSTEKERIDIKNLIHLSSLTQEGVNRVVDFVVECGGLAYAQRVLDDFLQKAQDDIAQLPQGIGRDVLSLLCNYLADRKK